MALPIWKLPVPFTKICSKGRRSNQLPRANRVGLAAPRLPVSGSCLNLDDATLERLMYLNVVLAADLWELDEHVFDVETARRHLERLFWSEAASVGRANQERCALQGVEPVTQLSVRLGKPPTSVADPGSDDERDKAIIRRGEAARILREDFPDFFRRDWDYSIYTEDVVLVDVYKRQCSGLQSYKAVFRGLRALGNLLCRGIDLHVTRMRQTGPENLDIEVRWQVRGTPFWSLNNEANIWDGKSTFKFDSQGRINTHIIDDKTFATFWRNVSLWNYLAELLAPAPEASGRLCPNWVPGPAMGALLASWATASSEKVDLAKRSLQEVWETLNTPPLLREQASSSMPGPLLMPSQG